MWNMCIQEVEYSLSKKSARSEEVIPLPLRRRFAPRIDLTCCPRDCGNHTNTSCDRMDLRHNKLLCDQYHLLRRLQSGNQALHS